MSTNLPAVPGWVIKPAAFIGAVMVIAMMFVTVIDVVGRYGFNVPLPGAIEANELLLAVMVFAGLPVAAARNEHIRIDILDHLLSRKALAIQQLAGSLIAAVVLAVLSWRLWLRGAELARLGDRSSHLDVPLGPLAWFMAVTAVIGAVIFMIVSWRAAQALRTGQAAIP